MRLEYLTDAQVQALDQFILRFTKLQDVMGVPTLIVAANKIMIAEIERRGWA